MTPKGMEILSYEKLISKGIKKDEAHRTMPEMPVKRYRWTS